MAFNNTSVFSRCPLICWNDATGMDGSRMSSLKRIIYLFIAKKKIGNFSCAPNKCRHSNTLSPNIRSSMTTRVQKTTNSCTRVSTTFWRRSNNSGLETMTKMLGNVQTSIFPKFSFRSVFPSSYHDICMTQAQDLAKIICAGHIRHLIQLRRPFYCTNTYAHH